jgi:hypothetical protein
MLTDVANFVPKLSRTRNRKKVFKIGFSPKDFFFEEKLQLILAWHLVYQSITRRTDEKE